MSADPDPLLAPLPAGSGAYSVARLAEAPARALTTSALQFAQLLRHSVARCSDPGATRLKLDWWREELTQVRNARHPLAQALTPLASDADGANALLAMIDAAEADVLRQQPADVTAFHNQCAQAGRLADLLCLAAGQRCDASALGTYAAAMARVRGLGGYLQRGHNPLPAGIGLDGEPADWPPHALADACQRLLLPLHEHAQAVLDDRARRTRPARRWAAIAAARHRLLARETFPVRDQLLDITPIAKLWTAWRVR